MAQFTTFQIFLSILLGLLTICTIVGNALVLYAFARGKKYLRSPTHYFLANLAVADFCVGLFVMPFLATLSVTKSWYFGETYCTIWEYIHYCLCASSILSMMGVCLERFIGIRYPLRHKISITRKRIKVSIVGIWIIAALVTATPLTLLSKFSSGAPNTCISNLRTDFMLYASIFIYWIPVCGLVIVYWLIYRNAVKRLELPVAGNTALSNEQNKDGTEAKEKDIRVAKKILIFVGTILLFYCPLFTAFFLRGIESRYFSIKLFAIAGWIRYSSSCLNPFLYALAVPGFRAAVREIFCSRQWKNEGMETKDKIKVNDFQIPKNKP